MLRRKRAVCATLAVVVATCMPAWSGVQPGRSGEHARFAISLGMGVGAHAAPYLVDYINAFSRPAPEQRLEEFSSILELFIVPELRVTPSWNVATEYSIFLKSHTVDDGSGFSTSDFSYLVHMPTLVVHYLVSGEGYYVKLGGGVGYHLASMKVGLRSYGIEERYTSKGIGVKLGAVGNTRFDDTLYGSIGVDLRWGFLGPFRTADGIEATERMTNRTATMEFFSVALKFGVLFQL